MSSNQNSSGASANQTCTEDVAVPRLLKSWCKSEECKKIIEEKKRIDDDILSIDYNETAEPKFVIKSKTESSKVLMKSALERLLDSQKSLAQKENDIHKEDRKIIQQLQGMKQVEFRVDNDLMGYVLGKKFSNITEIKKQTGVESIVVDDYMSIIRIIGKDEKCCNLAREKLEVIEKTITFPEEYTGLLVGTKGKNVKEYIDKSHIYRVNFESGSAKIIGTKKSVNYAESLIMDDINYIRKENELREKEDALYNKKLQFSTVKYNINNKNDKYYQYYDMYVNDGVIVHQPEPRFRGYIPNRTTTTTTTAAAAAGGNTTTTVTSHKEDEERKIERNVKSSKEKESNGIKQPTPVYRGYDSNADVNPTEDDEDDEDDEDEVNNNGSKEEYNKRGRSRGGNRGGYGYRGGRGGNRGGDYYNRGDYNNRGGRDSYRGGRGRGRDNYHESITLREKMQNKK